MMRARVTCLSVSCDRRSPKNSMRLDERHRQHAAALFAAGRDGEIADNLLHLRAHDALARPGLLISVERAVLARLGLVPEESHEAG
jgi:hypothetical protein